ncbi:hypothetical protein [Ferruginibacter sp.]|nr:hypothetical protein [Ferruginibacter sp.]
MSGCLFVGQWGSFATGQNNAAVFITMEKILHEHYEFRKELRAITLDPDK